MKQITFLSFAFSLALSMALSQEVRADFPRPELITVSPERAFIPPGFDSNDNAQIVITGYLANTCFKLGPTSAQVDKATKTITVTQKAYYYSSSWCLMIIVPYMQALDVGVLDADTYQVRFAQSDGETRLAGALPIAQALNPGPDDNLYALVKDATVVKNENGTRTLKMSGTLGSSCMYLDEVKVLHRVADVIEVLPIVGVRPKTLCQQVTTPFETEVTLPDTLAPPTLVHIRSMNGQAVNRMVDRN